MSSAELDRKRRAVAAKAKPSANGTHPPEEGYTAAALVAREFPPPRYAVEGLLTEGLTILGGRPKQGKSWLSLLIGWAVAAGYDLDGRGVDPGEVLYLALEDNPRRLKQRLLRLNARADWEVPEGLHLYTNWPRTDQGGLDRVAAWVRGRKSAVRLVIVDTLAKFRPVPRSGANGYGEDYAEIGALQKLCGELGVCALGVHHTRKLRAEDPFDELSGTLGVSGAADSLWVLERTRGDESGELYVTGRDLPEGTVPLTFSRADCRWKVGPSREGIDTAGRSASPAAGKLEQCKAWLKDFLRVYAYPSAEIDAAAKAAGYAPTTVRDAKVALGSKGTGEVTHKNFGAAGGNDWWSGIGPVCDWKRRPPADPDRESESQKPALVDDIPL